MIMTLHTTVVSSLRTATIIPQPPVCVSPCTFTIRCKHVNTNEFLCVSHLFVEQCFCGEAGVEVATAAIPTSLTENFQLTTGRTISLRRRSRAMNVSWGRSCTSASQPCIRDFKMADSTTCGKSVTTPLTPQERSSTARSASLTV